MSHVTAVVEVYLAAGIETGVLLNIVAGGAPSVDGSKSEVVHRNR